MERRLAMNSFFSHGEKERVAFTLVELLVVMAIIAILVAATVPAITSVVQGNNITRAGQEVADTINLARQVSSAKNTTVELRIFKLSGATTSGYNELQLGTNTATGTWTPVNRAVLLPTNIAIAENTSLSSAFSTYAALTMPAAGYGAQSSATYHPFEFRPSGILTPVLTGGMSAYSLAIVPVQYASTSTTALTSIKNYVVVEINPLTSTPLVYRP